MHDVVPYHEHDDADVREALAQALGERKVRLTDRRLLILFLACVTALTWLGVQQRSVDQAVARANRDREHFERAIIDNCRTNQKNTEKFNAFVDRIIASYATSPVLTPAQRQQRVDFFSGAKQSVPLCPPLGHQGG